MFQLRQFSNVLTNHQHKIVVIDRYLLDFIVDQTVNYGDISKSIITRFFLRKLMKIDLIIFIDVNIEIAMSRKTDIPSIEYLNERKRIYLHYISQFKNGEIIYNNGEITDAMNEIKKLLNKLTT